MEHEDEDEEDLDETDVKKAKRCYDQQLEEDDEAPPSVPPAAELGEGGGQSAGKGVSDDGRDEEADGDENEEEGDADEAEGGGGGASSVAVASSPAPFDLGPIGTYLVLLRLHHHPARTHPLD